jgi:ATP synthase subunit 6
MVKIFLNKIFLQKVYFSKKDQKVLLMSFTPFEQFEIVIIHMITLLKAQLILTNLGVLLLCITFFYILSISLISTTYTVVPRKWQNILEMIYLFVLSIVLEQSGKKGNRYFPQFFTIFILVLCYNIIGLLPFSFTASSHLIITLTLALSYFIAWIIIALKELHTNFLYVFCPKNMPAWLLPLLIIVEFLSFFLRPFSLGIRLFANMLAGHILLHILGGSFIYMYKLSIFLIIPIFVVLSAVGVLEIGISLLQAYIFTILLAIYLKDSLISH